ncbi:MAG: gamma-glutamyl-gamma-aminobutyrate hydrolase family protein [Lachnospiraceae bacterium]|nr:gamma-glutamyl-gamma-aminobutyrate hydrolase family protein [Lachnospiraceae bacterium]
MKILIAGYPVQTKNYCSAILQAGAQPILCDAGSDCDAISDCGAISDCSAISNCAALLLPGGGDIDPALFGDTNQGSRNIDRTLDLFQLALLDRFVKSGKPVLGICKGMQLINVYFGGSIVQDLPTASVHAWDNGDKLHPVFTKQNSFLSTLYGNEILVNSAHHQGIGTPGKGLRIIQTARDGVAEAFLHTALPIYAVQWHPERLCGSHARPDAADGSLLFRWFTQKQEQLP